VNKTKTLPVNVVDILLESVDYGKPILNKMTQLRCTAMLCFQNMVVGLSINDLGGVKKLKEIWIDMASTLVLQQSKFSKFKRFTNPTQFVYTQQSFNHWLFFRTGP